MLTAFFPAACLQMPNWYQVLTLQKLAKIVTGDQKAVFARQKEISPWVCSPCWVNLADHVGWMSTAAPYQKSPSAHRRSPCYSLDHFSWLVWSQQYFASCWGLKSDISPYPGKRDSCLPSLAWEHRGAAMELWGHFMERAGDLSTRKAN